MDTLRRTLEDVYGVGIKTPLQDNSNRIVLLWVQTLHQAFLGEVELLPWDILWLNKPAATNPDLNTEMLFPKWYIHESTMIRLSDIVSISRPTKELALSYYKLRAESMGIVFTAAEQLNNH